MRGEKTPALTGSLKGTKASNISAESMGRVNIHVQHSQGLLSRNPFQNKGKAETIRSLSLFFFLPLFLRNKQLWEVFMRHIMHLTQYPKGHL